jgi:hypothetical protein
MCLGDYDYDCDYDQASSRGDGVSSIIIFFLILIIFWLWPVAWIKQKPTAVASRGFLLNLTRSTSANGVSVYNDDDYHISSL